MGSDKLPIDLKTIFAYAWLFLTVAATSAFLANCFSTDSEAWNVVVAMALVATITASLFAVAIATGWALNQVFNHLRK